MAANTAKTKAKTDLRREAVAGAIEAIKERFGDGAIMRLGEAKKVDIDAISTGSVSLDIALGIGGVPRGRIIEVYGPESSGKSTLALHISANAQKAGGTVAYVDAEHALDPSYARRVGVDVDELLISQPDTGEQALEIVETLVQSAAVDLIVVDSVAALTPRAEIEGEMGDSHVGLQARLMSQALRKLTAISAKSNTTVIFINQIRMQIGVMFGNPETTTGGKALKFYSSVRIEVRRRAQIKMGEKIIGNRVYAKVVKNKVAPPFKVAEFDIMYNEGISYTGDLVDQGMRFHLVQKSGSWLSYGDLRLGQGREAAKRTLREDPKLAATLEEQIWAAVEAEEQSEEREAAGEKAVAEK
ncbi:MAG: recombinase RecA [Candidatus Andersenbacteria bacterium CG10_big_fil_rev_8_21_14_0_10_54_11]|uniref:Protein RecA n=1 Tax=Candidatus Andersenbacteria bacterium CG10_big_fil_rev_8_21_14_0_10_54_11 TaxID=1974485 RepID=A0A2M6WZF9_9BACT|nr:MAG: recombinase RecA [Candidatus Andersenbacteria bacterium CG10_big_fil_rev_8_21_14_0_10_54_11]